MGYDPLVRGPFAVAERDGRAIDVARANRVLPFVVWYPAIPPQSRERRPLILFSHASYGHRRQSSFLCAHLASHGYVVAAADHTGNTVAVR